MRPPINRTKPVSRPYSLPIRILLVLALLPVPALAQNLIANPGFENNPPSNFGNNIGHPITPWILGTGQTSNVVKVDGPGGFNYGNAGPESDADPATGAGVQQHYLDIASGTNDIYQSFVVPSCGGAAGQTRQATFSGWFSTRDNLSGGGAIRIRQGAGTTGAVLAQSSVNLPAPPSSATAPWVQASGTVTVTSGSTISFVVSLDNNLNFDQASLSFNAVTCTTAPLTLRKTWSHAVVNDTATLTVSRNGTVVDTLVSVANTPDETDSDTTPLTVFQGETLVLAETLGAGNAGLYATALACTGGGTLSGSTLTVGSSGAAIVCTYTNTATNVADLAITKSNGESAVLAGTPTTYTIVARNDGPNPVTGALVRDAPAAGLVCSGPVACSGAACPSATVPLASLTGSGVVLGTLANGASVTLQMSCTPQ